MDVERVKSVVTRLLSTVELLEAENTELRGQVARLQEQLQAAQQQQPAPSSGGTADGESSEDDMGVRHARAHTRYRGCA
jgi:hypothetical protein